MAISRLMLDNFPHIKAYWVMLGIKTAQVALSYGADDLDGTVVHEKIYHDAGSDTPQELTVAEIRRLIAEAGRVPVERDTLYHEVVREEATGGRRGASCWHWPEITTSEGPSPTSARRRTRRAGPCRPASPGPSRIASSRAIGTDAADVLPYWSRFTITRSAGKPVRSRAESMIRWLTWCGIRSVDLQPEPLALVASRPAVNSIIRRTANLNTSRPLSQMWCAAVRRSAAAA